MADFLYVDPIAGALQEWQNLGPTPASGSSFSWTWIGTISNGQSARGSCVEFANLYGLGRADYIGMKLCGRVDGQQRLTLA